MKSVTLFFIAACIAFLSCGSNPHDINVKRDMDYMYAVLEKSYEMMVEGIKTKNIDATLDAIDKYIDEEEPKIKMVGVRMDSVIMKEDEAMHIIAYNEKSQTLVDKYAAFIETNLNPAQRDRFVGTVVGKRINAMMDQLLVPKSSIDFFKKVIR